MDVNEINRLCGEINRAVAHLHSLVHEKPKKQRSSENRRHETICDVLQELSEAKANNGLIGRLRTRQVFLDSFVARHEGQTSRDVSLVITALHAMGYITKFDEDLEVIPYNDEGRTDNCSYIACNHAGQTLLDEEPNWRELLIEEHKEFLASERQARKGGAA